MVKILAALVAALSILNSSGASPGATEKVAALVARATCSGASHSSACRTDYCSCIDNIQDRLLLLYQQHAGQTSAIVFIFKVVMRCLMCGRAHVHMHTSF